MRTPLLLAALMATALPVMANAQTYDAGCRRANSDTKTTGTVLGAIGGALLGSAVAGRHDRGTGAVIGGLGGAVVGNQIARGSTHPCPEGYEYVAPPTPAYGPPPQTRDGYDRGGYNQDRYGPAREGTFWYGAPEGVHERIDFIQERINRSAYDRRLSRREVRSLTADLNDIRRQERHLQYRDGGRLNAPDHSYLMDRLDRLSRRLHWQADRG